MIGVFGGTFDPVHNGHLRTVLDVKEALDLDEVRLIPLREAVHRDQPATPAEIRFALVQAAIGGTPGLVADGRELSRAGPSYTFDTLLALRRDFGEDLPIVLILGADAFNGFLAWHRPHDIPGLAHIAVMERAGHEVQAAGDLGDFIAPRLVASPADLRASPAGCIFRVPVTALEISSSDIRHRLASGMGIRFMVPEPVETLIGRLGLYGNRLRP